TTSAFNVLHHFSGTKNPPNGELKLCSEVTTLNTLSEKMRTALVIFSKFCFIFPTYSKNKKSIPARLAELTQVLE
ncbi:hypothetical protein FQ007_26925, partial [Escherichia coli]|uniref:hypothetical protein n=1 Tax=Escherichia coli TaxID=562 RepID=UPI00139AF688